jgi:hypothetical protein
MREALELFPQSPDLVEVVDGSSLSFGEAGLPPFPPAPVRSEDFWLIAEGVLDVPCADGASSCQHRLTAVANDGVRLFVDGSLVVDSWAPAVWSARHNVLLRLERGHHTVRVEYFRGSHRVERLGGLSGEQYTVPSDGWWRATERSHGALLRVFWQPDAFGMKVYVYELPGHMNVDVLASEPRCEKHMFAAEVHIHRTLLSSPVRTLDPAAADWFYVPVYTSCKYLPSPWFGVDPWFGRKQAVAAIKWVKQRYPYFLASFGKDHVMAITYDYGACFEYKKERASVR